ncbi:MAG: hypothetical protein ACM3X1_02750 [Ignavibacteriales bacterium]
MTPSVQKTGTNSNSTNYTTTRLEVILIIVHLIDTPNPCSNTKSAEEESE